MSMDPEIRRAHAARVPYSIPGVTGDPDSRHLRWPPTADVDTSYATQVHWRREGWTRWALRLGADDGARPDAPVTDAARWIVTAWNAVGRECLVVENARAQDRLRERVSDLGGRVVDVLVTTPPDRSWVEESLLVEGLGGEDVARSVGRESGQAAVTAVLPDRLVVVPTGLVDAVRRHGGRREEVALPVTCPMRSDDVPGERCVMHGGPWGSSAIHAALWWKVHRALLLRLGCGPCDDGRGPTLGPLGRSYGAIPLSGLVLASRWGGYAWR